MEIEHTRDSQAADALLDESLSEEWSAGLAPADVRPVRLERVADYETAGLAKPEPLEACLAAVNADLIRIAYRLGSVVEQSLAVEPVSAESVRRVEAALNNHLRVTRQIDRFAQLEVRAAEARQEATNAKIKQQMMTLQGPLNDASRRSVRSVPGRW